MHVREDPNPTDPKSISSSTYLLWCY